MDGARVDVRISNASLVTAYGGGVGDNDGDDVGRALGTASVGGVNDGVGDRDGEDVGGDVVGRSYDKTVLVARW